MKCNINCVSILKSHDEVCYCYALCEDRYMCVALYIRVYVNIHMVALGDPLTHLNLPSRWSKILPSRNNDRESYRVILLIILFYIACCWHKGHCAVFFQRGDLPHNVINIRKIDFLFNIFYLNSIN